MNRDVDRVIDYINGLDYIPPVHRRVMVNRLDPRPTQAEIDRAAAEVYPERKPGGER
jgi:hypothetical protein